MRLIDADALIDFIDCGHLRNPLESCFSERDNDWFPERFDLAEFFDHEPKEV